MKERQTLCQTSANKNKKDLQRRESRSLLQRCKALIVDDDGLEEVTAVNDTVADMDDLRAVDAGLAFEVVEEVMEGGIVVCDGLRVLLLGVAALFGGCRSELEREDSGRCGDIADTGFEQELDGLLQATWLRGEGGEEAEERDLQRRRASVDGEDETAAGCWC